MSFHKNKKKLRIYFHIDEVARDSVVASALKKTMATKDVDVVYGNRLNSVYIRDFKEFDLYIFPSIDLFAAFCKNPVGITAPVVILPSESVGGSVDNIARLASKYLGTFPEKMVPWFESIAAFCVWGPSHLRVFSEMRPNLLGKAHVIGHPRFGRRCMKSRANALANTDGGTKGKNIVVGFITRFSPINDFMGRGVFDTVFYGRKNYYADGRIPPRYSVEPDKDIEDVIYKEVLDLRLMFDLMAKLAKQGVKIQVRVHPRENRLTWVRILKEIAPDIKISAWDQPFQHWLSEVTHVVGPTSTSFYDCILSGVMPICTNAIVKMRAAHLLGADDDDNPILDHVLMPKSIDEVMSLIDSTDQEPIDLSKRPELSRLLHVETNYPESSDSIDNLAHVCYSLLDGNEHHRTHKLSYLCFLIKGYAKTIFVLSGRLLYVAFPFAFMKKRFDSEQGSTFVLSASRKRWIDSLAS